MSKSEFSIEVVGRKALRRDRKNRASVVPTKDAKTGNLLGALLGLAWFMVKPRRPTWVLAATAYVLVAHGTPHLLIAHNCTGVGTPGRHCTACRYVGVQGIRGHLGREFGCPVITMLPVNWAALGRTLNIG